MSEKPFPPDGATQEFLRSEYDDKPIFEHQLVQLSKRGVEIGRYAARAGVLTIGRLQDNKVRLEHNSVSRRHARLWIVGGVCWLEDLRSNNGTFVNGEKIRQRRLRDGDRIEIGAIHLRFVVSEADAVAGASHSLPVTV